MRWVLAPLLSISVLVHPASGGAQEGGGAPPPTEAPAPDPAFRGIELVDGRRIPGRVTEQQPGAYAIVEGSDGQREAVEWSRIARIDGRPPPPVPPARRAELIPEGFTPDRVAGLAEAGQSASGVLPGLIAPKDGSQLIGSIKGAQDALERAGLKRKPPSAYAVVSPIVMMPLCFEMIRGTLGRVDGSGGFGAACTYVLLPLNVAMLVLAPFTSGETEEMKETSVHHLSTSVYALDYEKKSALTGTFNRAPSGGFLGYNLGYDVGYTYIHPTMGLVGYGHLTLQQSSMASTRYLQVSNSFFKGDAQVGLDLVRLLSGGRQDSYWAQHTAFARGGLSFFHDWIISRDVGTPEESAAVDNPLNNSIGLVTGVGYEIAAEVDFRFPDIHGWSTGGVHFKFERGSYPSLSFPALDPREAAFVALIGFDDLRQGSTYTWQRLKLEVELPINYSRAGGFFLGGQLVSYENNFGSGVDNRGLSLDYRLRFP